MEYPPVSDALNIDTTPAAADTAPVSTMAPGDVDTGLPASFERIIAEASDEMFGVDRVRWFIQKVRELPIADRDQARSAYERLVHRMIKLNASDLDLGGPASNDRAWYRVDGFKRPHEDMGFFTQDEATLVILSLLTPQQQDQLVDNFAIDFGYTLVEHVEGEPDRRFRTTVYFDNQQLALCKRMLAWKPRSLRSLGFHPVIEQGFMFRHIRDGITLFTGVTGSGKSTSLDAIIDANNMDFEGHILIVAQPLEYIHTSKKCIVRHREVGTDVKSFVDGMIQGLRQDPDIVVVGEMRDPETISTAMETADTGHKVFSTLHTGSAVESIERIIAEYPSVEQDRVRHRLADVLRCVVSQKLLPAVGGGRILAKEVLWMTPSSRAAIKNGNINEIYQMIWQGSEQGMVTLEQDLARLVQVGDVTLETALDYANNKRRFLSLLR
ncbi:MAG: type IV pilus twitching motility protein PilT [Rubricoccaceae bacterium]|nr:type IV pilus twitching motility protein PilT [Rubricoccaceae bacterium]